MINQAKLQEALDKSTREYEDQWAVWNNCVKEIKSILEATK